MPFNVHCSQCGGIFPVPDEAAGKTTACPFCRQWTGVPENHARPAPLNAEAPLRRHLEEYRDTGNPFEPPPPDEGFVAAPRSVAQPTEPVWTVVPIGEMFSSVWFMLSRYLMEFLVWGLLVAALLLIFFLSLGFLFAGVALLAESYSIEMNVEAIGIGIVSLSLVLFALFALFMVMGAIRWALFLARGGKGNYGLLFYGGRHWLRGLGLTVLIGILTAAWGFLSLSPASVAAWFTDSAESWYPVFIVLFLLWQAGLVLIFVRLGWSFFFLVDRNNGIFESLSASWRFSKGNVFSLFTVCFCIALLHCLLLLCCNLWLFAGPFFLVIPSAMLYLKMTGQPNVMFNPAIHRLEW